MLNYAEGAKEDGDKDVIDILMEEDVYKRQVYDIVRGKDKAAGRTGGAADQTPA